MCDRKNVTGVVIVPNGTIVSHFFASRFARKFDFYSLFLFAIMQNLARC